MADSTRPSDSNSGTADDAGVGPGRGSPPAMPRWVKVSGIIVAVLILFLVGMMFMGGDHGPGRHGPGRATGDAEGADASDMHGKAEVAGTSHELQAGPDPTELLKISVTRAAGGSDINSHWNR